MGTTDRRYGSKLPKWANRDTASGIKYDAATYLGIVKDNTDPARSGRLRVWIPDMSGDENNPLNWRTVSYASPYFGSTYQPDTSKNNSYEGVQHTYGMWMVPPDRGNQVLCTFVAGDPDRGYWFACVNPTLSHYMVPGIAAGNKVDASLASDSVKPSLLPNSVPPQSLPVAEFNENAPDAMNENFARNSKPIHEFQANVLFTQGLDRDNIRGAISSSSQRETPSHVFGISTPGRAFGNDPADDPEYQKKLNSGTLTDKELDVRSRKGGHQFVMDDGDVNGKDQLVRLRTAGGHQVLMNDSEGILYIANDEGSVWVEFSPTGHLHFYSAGGYNVRTEGDLNLHAGRNINMQAESEVNISGSTALNLNSAKVNLSGTESALVYGATVDVGSSGAITVSGGTTTIGGSSSVTIAGSKIALNSGSGGTSIGAKIVQPKLHNDTTFDDKTQLWMPIPQATNSIVSVLPSHEPWVRSGTPATPAAQRQITSAICPAKPGSPTDYTLPKPNGNKLDNGKVKGQPAPWTTDTAFLDKVKSVALSLNCNYIDLLACINLETITTFDPAIVNGIGATGLIQFVPSTASGIGTSTSELAQLNRVDQMDWVLKYFQANRLNAKAPTPTLTDLYTCIFYPAAVGKTGYTIGAVGSNVWNQNPSLRGPNNGDITTETVTAAIAPHITTVKQALANSGATTQPSNLTNTTPISDGAGNVVKPSSPQGGNNTSGQYTAGNAQENQVVNSAFSDAYGRYKAGTPSGTVYTTTSGSTPTNTATTSGALTDVGIKEAAGKAVTQPTCPAEYLNKTDTYTPPSGIGSSTPKFTQFQVKCLMAELGYFTSKFNYSLVDNGGANIGKYGVNGAYLSDSTRGYIKPDAVTQYGSANVLANNESWTNKDKINSRAAFFDNRATQDTIQFTEFQNSYAALISNGGIKSTDDICTAAGMMFVVHYKARTCALGSGAATKPDMNSLADAAKAWRDKGGDSQAGDYFNHGRYAIDILSANGGSSPTSGLNGANKTNINPDDVLVFTSGLGDRAHFDSTTSEFKTAILNAAKAWYDLKKSKVVVNTSWRSFDEQTNLYNRWKTGEKGVFMPAKPGTSPHEKGVAMDTSQAQQMASSLNLAEYNLEYIPGYPKDPPHIRLKGGGGGKEVGGANKPTAQANEGAPIVICFRGLNPETGSSAGVDQLYSALKAANYDAYIYDYQDTGSALSQINAWQGKVALVGFSKGAESIRNVAASMGGRSVDLLVGVDPWYTVNQQYSTTLGSNIKQARIIYSPNGPSKNGGTQYSGPDGRMSWEPVSTNNHAQVMIGAVSEIVGLVGGI